MYFGVNRLTEIFRDTHTLRYQRQALFLTVVTDVPREHLYVPNQTRIHAEGETPHISPLTRAEKRREGGDVGRNEWTEGEKKEGKGERKKERYACVREHLGATNERVRRGNRDRQAARSGPRGSRHRQIGPTYFRPRSICSFDVKPVVGIRPRTRNSYETPKERFPAFALLSVPRVRKLSLDWCVRFQDYLVSMTRRGYSERTNNSVEEDGWDVWEDHARTKAE